MKKSIMILGAGAYQVPLIKEAKAMGLNTVVCSIEGNYPGFKIADNVRYVNTTDCEACLEVAKEFNIAGVCTTGTDVALPSLGRICDTLKLSGPSEKSAILSSNKRMMKEAFDANNVLTAKFKVVHNLEECINAVEEIGLPSILKVCDSSGSRGICVIRKKKEIEEAYRKVKPFTKLPYILVEEFLIGEEMGAQAFVMNHNVLLTMPHGDYVYCGNTGVPIGHYTPYNNDNSITSKIEEETKRAINALEIDNAAVNIDFMLVNGNPYVLEVGARGGATCLPELVSLHYGINYYKMIIECALGLTPSELDKLKTNKNRKAVVAKLITSDCAGIIQSYNIPTKNNNLSQWSLDYNIGDRVNAFNIGPDRLGQVICVGKDIKEAEIHCNKTIEEINLNISK